MRADCLVWWHWVDIMVSVVTVIVSSSGPMIVSMVSVVTVIVSVMIVNCLFCALRATVSDVLKTWLITGHFHVLLVITLHLRVCFTLLFISRKNTTSTSSTTLQDAAKSCLWIFLAKSPELAWNFYTELYTHYSVFLFTFTCRVKLIIFNNGKVTGFWQFSCIQKYFHWRPTWWYHLCKAKLAVMSTGLDERSFHYCYFRKCCWSDYKYRSWEWILCEKLLFSLTTWPVGY